ncbi:ankyrin repeat-containing domain protein [Lactarius deliciosus]|nr:ankyrin repeat-containing domain protein [Lactarius deliciosus]
MQQIASNMNKSQRDQLHDKSRQWLSPADPSTNYNIACKTYHDGTATWFIQGTTFREWQVTGSLLWIHGRPGSGKSILCYSIIRQVTRLCDAGLALMAYFYFDFKDTAKQDARAALSSLLIQLCYQSDPCSDILGRLYSDHRSGGMQPSDDTLAKCLSDMLALPRNGPTYIILDALDECPRSAGTPSPRESALELVRWLTKLGHPNLHVCVTSRPEADITADLQPLASHCVSLHEQSGQQEDINDYIVSFTNTDTYMRKWKQEIKELVIERLTRGVDGMFRWVFCQLDSLRRCLPGRIRRALEELPSTLDATYERTLLDIDEANFAYAHRLFQCITVASRPLRVEELAEFLAFDFDGDDSNPKFDADWRPEDPDHAVLSTCSSLISVVNVEGTAIVQFSHFSVKEFLTSNRIARGRLSRFHIPLEPAHLMAARACITILLQLDGSVSKDTIKELPLAFYAAQYWVDHAKFGDVSLHARDAIRRVFDPTEPYFSAWDWLRDHDGRRESISATPSTPRMPPLHRAAWYDLGDVAEWLITSRSQDPDGLSGRSTPLYYASASGSLKVAQVLIEHGADVNAPHTPNNRPLHAASASGNLEVLRLLVAGGADVNARDNDWTAVHFASIRGHLEVVRFLLENNADPNVRRWNGNALNQALEHDHSQVAQLLLKYGADIDAPDKSGETLLHQASKHGHLKVAQQLLERGADVHARNHANVTALQVALRWQRREIVQLLLQFGAESS